MGLDVSEALLDDLVAAIDVNKNGLIEMKEFVHALKLPDDVADPKAAPAVASAPDPEPAAAEPDPQADPLPPEAAPAPPEANSASVEVEDTTMAGLAKRASQASRASKASQGSKGFQAQAQMVESLESPGVVEKVRSASRSPRDSALQALQDQSATLEPGPEETPAEAPPAQAEVASIREAAATRPEAAGTRPSVTPRKSQAKAASSSGGLLSRASRAVGAITGGSSTSASRRQTQRTTLNRGSPSPRPRSTTGGSTFR